MQTKQPEKYVIRFERAGHREEIKAMAQAQKRSLNKQILVLIEAGQQAVAAKAVQQ